MVTFNIDIHGADHPLSLVGCTTVDDRTVQNRPSQRLRPVVAVRTPRVYHAHRAGRGARVDAVELVAKADNSAADH
jgi:hypothetical protein